MINTMRAGPRTPGKPSDNDIDVNQNDHISSQVEEEEKDDTKEEDANIGGQKFEENDITDEDAENLNHIVNPQ
ncbi:hypothetical protein SAMN05518672_103100 [Chitinophaga sp. CF118]|uniref:hypothetical protein n=1 Tax=Chitinophaga sp. CF118 TaxID=1884367 RepID=UPI0008F0C317|nr:hypothetical protein [Chitinophaga sp. CF118]SFD75928.1 hypothetical protein SAMN05518672_103100 [Chitinophaga sp. CF118]